MPRNILSIPPKRTPSLTTPLTTAIRNYISNNYTDTHPDAFTNDIRDFVRLRDAAASAEVHVASIEPLLKYHAQLVFFATKFPSDINLSFPWSLSFPSSLPSWTTSISGAMEATKSAEAGPAASGISYATSDSVAHPDLAYERANVLFSLASLYSALGCAESRADKESIKRATAWFQNAAGIIQYIIDNLVEPTSHLTPPSPDLHPRLLACVRDVMLAQAQECFWQKAVMDRLKDATIAKLAEKVAEYYASALAAVSDTTVDSKGSKVDGADVGKITLPSGWENHLTVKRYHFAAAALYRKACDDLASNRYGDELGRLHVAEGHVKKALDSAKRGVSEAITSDLKSLQQIIQTNIARATRDNDLIYLEAVTPASQLAPIQAAAMVKAVTPPEVAQPIGFLNEGSGYGRPLFAELVPYGVHLAISIYDDRKDSYVRDEIAGVRDEMDAMATSTLQSLNLPGSLQALEQPMGLPPSLLRKHEEVVAQGGLDRLQRIAADVARIAATDRDTLSEALALIEHEEREDESVRVSFSSQSWGRQASNEVNCDLKAQAAEYHGTLMKAAASDEIVRHKLEDWEDLIGVLSGNVIGLENFVPSSNPSVSSASKGGDKQVQAVRALREELEHLDDLLDSRSACVSEAKALAAQDDVRPLVLREASRLSTGTAEVAAADFEELFDKELSKYSRFKADLDESAKAQSELLERIQVKNAAFVEARKSDATIQRREKALQNLDAAYVKYRELSSNLVEGLEFYNGLAKILSAYRDGVKEWARARQVDLHWLIHQMGRVSVQDQNQNQNQEQMQSQNIAQPQHQQEAPVQEQQQTSRRQTRASARLSQQAQPQQAQQAQPETPAQQPPPPQWGALPPGAKIQFKD